MDHTSYSKYSGRVSLGSIITFAVAAVCLILTVSYLLERFFGKEVGVPRETIKQFLGSMFPSSDLSPEIVGALVEVKGESGTGTGFLTIWKDKTFIVTNIHVIHNNEELTYSAATGENLKTGAHFLARDYDVAIIEVIDPPSVLQVMEGIDSENILGERVIVPGNSLGSGVFTSIQGKIIGLGPRLVETDAKFVSGNSGSPIIISKAFNEPKVIGIATYTTTVELKGRDSLSQFKETRWFGYRLDNIKNWERLEPKKFAREGTKIDKVEERTQDIITLLTEGTGRLLKDPDFKELVKSQQYAGNVERRSAETREHTFLTYLRHLITKDIKHNSSAFTYGYYQERFKKQKDIRDDILEYLEVASIPHFSDFYADPGHEGSMITDTE